jgi:alpha-1,3-rhamnosyltransferase
MLVSVVIPSYNHKDYVLQAIESALSQSWQKIDLIVIDDGSRDGSPEVIRKYYEARGDFRFIARENRGLLKTLNEGLGLARGELFCELASDDYLPVDSVEQRVTYLQEHPECVAVFGDGYRVENEVLTDQRFVDERRRRLFSSKDPVPEMLGGALPVFSTGLIRRQALLAIGGFDDRTFHYYEDLDTPILLSLEGRLGFVDAPLICRRQHETNVSSSPSHIRVEKVLYYQKLLSEPRMGAYRNLLKRQMRRSLLALGRHLSKVGKGTPREREVLCQGWAYAFRDPRLCWYLMRWGKE